MWGLPVPLNHKAAKKAQVLCFRLHSRAGVPTLPVRDTSHFAYEQNIKMLDSMLKAAIITDRTRRDASCFFLVFPPPARVLFFFFFCLPSIALWCLVSERAQPKKARRKAVSARRGTGTEGRLRTISIHSLSSRWLSIPRHCSRRMSITRYARITDRKQAWLAQKKRWHLFRDAITDAREHKRGSILFRITKPRVASG